VLRNVKCCVNSLKTKLKYWLCTWHCTLICTGVWCWSCWWGRLFRCWWRRWRRRQWWRFWWRHSFTCRRTFSDSGVTCNDQSQDTDKNSRVLSLYWNV